MQTPTNKQIAQRIGEYHPANLPDIMNEEFDASELHPQELSEIIEAAFTHYKTIPAFTKPKRAFRDKLNTLIDTLSDARSFQQFSYCK